MAQTQVNFDPNLFTYRQVHGDPFSTGEIDRRVRLREKVRFTLEITIGVPDTPVSVVLSSGHVNEGFDPQKLVETVEGRGAKGITFRTYIYLRWNNPTTPTS